MDESPLPTPAQLAYVLNPDKHVLRAVQRAERDRAQTEQRFAARTKNSAAGAVQRGMTRTMFTKALEGVFGPALGASLFQDLQLPAYGCTASEALHAGHEPLDVWHSLLIETGKDTPENLWWHRRDVVQRGR